MDERVPHVNITFDWAEIEWCTTTVACVEVKKEMIGMELPVSEFESTVDLLMFYSRKREGI